MNHPSRRQFVKSCLYLTGFGMSPFGFCLHTGCREEDPARVADDSDQALRKRSTGATADIDPAFTAPYVRLHKSGELKQRGEALWRLMKACRLCPRACGVNRLEGEKGVCQSTDRLEISAYHPHFGEERPLVGRGGSGTVFLANCGLRCVFCINWEISQGGAGTPREVAELAGMMCHLQRIGCHNINFVTPTHYVPHIVLAVDRAAGKGLRLPLVYNTCGWERLEILKYLDGVIDIYLPDFKYWEGGMAAKYSSDAENYPEVTKTAVLEMNRQVGVARPHDDGLMYRGLMIRHLVMPNRVSGTRGVIEWIARNLPKDTYLNLMSQYRPMYRAFVYPEIARRISRKEFSDAVEWARAAGLTRLDIQSMPLLY